MAEGIIVYKRKGLKPKDDVLVALNTTPIVRNNWEIHIEGKHKWKEIFNSDSKNIWV